MVPSIKPKKKGVGITAANQQHPHFMDENVSLILLAEQLFLKKSTLTAANDAAYL
jgi:hypothetical protein